MLYGEDCPKCEVMKDYWIDIAPKLAKVENFKLGYTDMTNSIFWGIWPYDLPHRRYYNIQNSKQFRYVYEDMTWGATVKYLKKNSVGFQKHLKYAHASYIYHQMAKGGYYDTHCYNYLNDPRKVMEHMLYTNYNYDDLV